eukprot:TRINITY_DN8222_c0_g1_i1.p1 TRINITY_DN8222_c0_g1~~TRINITY_DN8222_c0_g1_i1.p1  ORF type:complete len:476 (-),score=156.08 TRINITY_DN8222_c0_g1_i1:8-1435(-)
MEVLTYLATLPQELKSQLFGLAPTCKAIFRTLSPVGKQLILRMLHANKITLSNPHATVKEQLKLLEKLELIDIDEKNHVTQVQINNTFQTRLKEALYETVNKDAVDMEVDGPATDVIDQYAREQWEQLLLFVLTAIHEQLVRTGDRGGIIPKNRPELSPSLVQLLTDIGLIEDSGDYHAVTPLGLKFIFDEQAVQIWTLVQFYIDHLSRTPRDRVEIINFIFQLNFLAPGRGYSSLTLTAAQQRALRDLHELGLLYMDHEARDRLATRVSAGKKAKSVDIMYYPTMLAVDLIGHQSRATEVTGSRDPPGLAGPLAVARNSSAVSSASQLVLESNLQLFSRDTCQSAILRLALFTTIQAHLPGLVVTRLTRESIRRALTLGLDVTAITQWITRHAPRPPAPVLAQLNLWAQEGRRLTAVNAVSYEHWTRDEDFMTVLNYARDLGVLLWHHREKRILIIAATAHIAIKEFIKNNIVS